VAVESAVHAALCEGARVRGRLDDSALPEREPRAQRGLAHGLRGAGGRRRADALCTGAAAGRWCGAVDRGAGRCVEVQSLVPEARFFEGTCLTQNSCATVEGFATHKPPRRVRRRKLGFGWLGLANRRF